MKKFLIIIGIGILIALGIITYLFNKPHRDVQAQSADFSYPVSTIVNEYLNDPITANQKYLDEEGESKILNITGVLEKISKDFNNQTVLLLKEKTDKAGVSATLTLETESSAKNIKVGQTVTVKGVIRSGANYDEDLESYEDVILEKCKVISNQ